MAKSTVRFPEGVLALVEQYIDDGEFTNKSEFQRFAVEYLLVQLEEEYEPTMAEFDEIREDVLDTPDNDASEYIQTAESSDFLRTASRVRQAAVRGDLETAYELIDTRCAPESPRAMILDLVVQGAASTRP
jgi:Arc/MetJ-type ribon-helix-helix transcriptional regulator